MEQMSLNWYWPLAFFLLPLPLLIRFLVPEFKRQRSALKVPNLNQWAIDTNTATARSSSWQPLLIPMLAWVLFVTALARPYWLGEEVSKPVSGRDLLLAVDISGSMQQEDMEVNGSRATRLAAVKQVVDEFIQQRESDRVGLILFGSNAYVQSPLTFDHDTVQTYLHEAQIGLAGKETAIGNAIGLGIKRLIDHPAESRVMILLTDGANTAGDVDPEDAAKLAADSKVRIYTIGLGADEMYVRSLFGTRRVNPSQDLDEGLLKNIATTTGGQFFRARDTEELSSIYQLIDQLEPIEQDPEVFRPQQSLYFWPLATALILVFFNWLIGFSAAQSLLQSLLSRTSAERSQS
ncbi:MAG: vWA domain-containing protein [Oceanobacter sp.]